MAHLFRITPYTIEILLRKTSSKYPKVSKLFIRYAQNIWTQDLKRFSPTSHAIYITSQYFHAYFKSLLFSHHITGGQAGISLFRGFWGSVVGLMRNPFTIIEL
uniref:Uncharacterized protein n=1 Tax=Cacopsylla melanoneura TaxID=428564 RepID=A0A8D8TV68_9HEMI